MDIFTHVNKDNTIFKTLDGKYINHRGCDITGIVRNRFKPFKMISILPDQPKYYLVQDEWNEEEESFIPINIQGPYSDKEEVESKTSKTAFILLATESSLLNFKSENNL